MVRASRFVTVLDLSLTFPPTQLVNIRQMKELLNLFRVIYSQLAAEHDVLENKLKAGAFQFDTTSLEKNDAKLTDSILVSTKSKPFI